MRTLLMFVTLSAAFIATASAGSIDFVQDGWSTGGTLAVSFSGHDANGDGAIFQSELTRFSAVWTTSTGGSTDWTLPQIEPDGFVFTDLGNFLLFARNPEFSIVDTSFEGEALATVFDASLFPVDSTVSPAATPVPEPGGLAILGLACLAMWKLRPIPG